MIKNLDNLNFDWGTIKNKHGFPITIENKNIYRNLFYHYAKKDIPQILEEKAYLKEEINETTLEKFIDEFRLFFPKENRDYNILEEGFYFDDILEAIFNYYQNIAESSVLYDVLKVQKKVAENEQSFRIIKTATEADTKNNPYLKLGEEYSQLREFNSYEEGLGYIQKVDSLRLFGSELKKFHKTYGEGVPKIYQQELDKINDFITQSESIDISKTFKDLTYGNELFEYIRIHNNFYLKKYNDYYKGKNNFYPTIFFEGRYAPVYAKYVLYKKWLEEKLNIFSIPIKKAETPSIKIESPEHLEIECIIKDLNLKYELTSKLIRRLGELYFCKNHLPNLILSSIVLTGSILEGVLLGLAIKSENICLFNKSSKSPKDKNGKVKNHQSWSFKDFIEVSKDINLLNDSFTNAEEIMKKRNYIHPHKEFISNDIYSTHYQDETYSDLKLVLKEISRNLHVLKQV